MQIGPEESVTARDAALDASRQFLPPLSDSASVGRQLANATHMLLGHSTDAAASSSEIGGRESTSGDLEPEMLGGPDAAEALPMAESALSTDPSTAPPNLSLPSAMDLDGEQSPIDFPNDPIAFDSDESIAPPTFLSTAADSSLGTLALADSAADFDWSEPSASASSIASPVSSSDDGQGFETAGASPVADASTAPQPEHDESPDFAASEAESDGRDSLPESATSASDKEPGVATTLTVTLTDREQLVAAAAAEVAALAKAAARTTAESVIDERLVSLRTQDDARQTARAAIFGY